MLSTVETDLPLQKAEALKKWLRSTEAALFVGVLESQAAHAEVTGVIKTHESRDRPHIDTDAKEHFERAFRLRSLVETLLSYQQKESFAIYRIDHL